MDAQKARDALKALGMTQLDLAADLRAITGGAYHAPTVNKWFKDRGPSDICAVYLTLALRAKGKAQDE